jgi:hypothetical protein
MNETVEELKEELVTTKINCKTNCCYPKDNSGSSVGRKALCHLLDHQDFQ